MAIAQSKLTSQGQVSIPAPVRKRLGVGPGSVLEWDEKGRQIVVRRAGTCSSEDIHKALFPDGARARTLNELKEGIRTRMKRKHASR
ncbi:MAG: AbrB/MazE/SpoVT family DNA-binding domain-containing protein [Nitrospirae bacterium]|nr:AbrB/MazE/SpoVT family DNA-binding domain-containing protein [Nitrospirota bacterium]